MKKLTLKASCLCGGIQLRTNGYHRDIKNCHCIQCMKTHGHYAAYTSVQEQNVKFFKIIGSNNISIAAGMFNGPTKLKTKMNIFVKGKPDYYRLDNRLSKFKRYP